MTLARVEVFGLKSAKDLNGKIGSLGQFHSQKQRVEVLFEDGSSKLVKPECMRRIVAETYTKINIVALCAVHIHDESRCRGLENCLRTIRQQSSPPDLLLIGWSAGDASTRTATAQFFQEMMETKVINNEPSSVEGCSSQFQHFQRLLQDPRLSTLACNGKATWIVFSDDDDLWHPERVYSYRHVIETMATLPDDRDVRSMSHAQICPGVREIASSFFHSEVMLQDGLAKRVVGAEDDRLEYFDYALRLDLMQDFFEWISSGLLEHKFCDRALLRFLALAGRESVFFHPGCWMYFYNRPICEGVLGDAALPVTLRSEHLSSRLAPSAEDRDMASQAVQDGVLVSALHSTPETDVFCARSNLENYLIESYLGKPIDSEAMTKLANNMSRDLRLINGCNVKTSFLVKVIRKSCESFGIETRP